MQNELEKGILRYVDSSIENAPYTQIYTGLIKASTSDGYTISLNGVEYANVPSKGTFLTNDTVRVVVPNNQYSNMFILSDSTGGSVTGTVSSVNGMTGDVTISNVPSSDKLSSPKTISLSGDVTGNISTDFSTNPTISVTVVDDSHNHIISNVDGLQTSLDGKSPIASPTFTGVVTAPRFASTIATGTAPLTVASTTLVTNLNADLLDGLNSASTNTASTIVARDSSGNFSAGTITANLTGNSSTSTKLVTARNISLSGDVTGSVSFDGSGNSNIVTTVVDDSHNHIISNVDNLQTTLNIKADLVDGKVPSSQLPSFVDDVLEYATLSVFPAIGTSGIIYIDLSTNLAYRWSGTVYVEISPSLALGETSSTAYRGDRGKIAYDHSQKTSGNPHKVTKNDVGLGNVGNYKSVSVSASQGLTDTEKANARANIGAGIGNSNFSGAYADLSGKPTLGTAASKDVASSGNASTTQVVMGNDTRLTDARKASDVSAWAKATTKPSYTKSEVGLGNVPNVTTNNQTPTFTMAGTDSNLVSGETLTIAFGKIAKSINSLITHIADNIRHITSTERTRWNVSYTNNHTHSNKTILDNATASYTTTDKTKLNGIESGAQVNDVTGVKGDSEGSYKVGNVNITKTNIGLGSVDNTSDATKNVLSAEKLRNLFSTRPRPTSANLPIVGDGSLKEFKATFSMTESKPPEDAHVLHFEWDNSGGYNSQLAISNENGNIYFRGMTKGVWTPWYMAYSQYSKQPDVAKLTTPRTISLTGDVTGSVSFDGSANVSITSTVADDSHNHVISNVDNLQTSLDAKAPLVSPSLAGTPLAPTATQGTNTTQIATTAFVQTAINTTSSIVWN